MGLGGDVHLVVPRVDVGAPCDEWSDEVVMASRRHRVESGLAKLRWGGGEALAGSAVLSCDG